MLEQVEDSGSASVVSQLEAWRDHTSGRIVGAQGKGLTRMYACVGGLSRSLATAPLDLPSTLTPACLGRYRYVQADGFGP